MSLKLLSLFPAASTALVTLTFSGCGSGWSGVHKEAGPLPLSSADKPIVRLVDKRTTFEVGQEKRLFWDEGSGPVLAKDRIRQLLECIPKDLSDRLHSTRDVPAKLYPTLRDAGNKGTTYENIYDTWVTVVSLNPDVLIVSARETPVGPHSTQPRSWDRLSIDQARRDYIDRRVELISRTRWPVDVGTLVPWSEEMYVFSTDSNVKNGRVLFQRDHSEVLLPVGKLLLNHHADDVEVTRE